MARTDIKHELARAILLMGDEPEALADRLLRHDSSLAG